MRPMPANDPIWTAKVPAAPLDPAPPKPLEAATASRGIGVVPVQPTMPYATLLTFAAVVCLLGALAWYILYVHVAVT